MGPDFNQVIRVGIQVCDQIANVARVRDFCAEKVTASDPSHA